MTQNRDRTTARRDREECAFETSQVSLLKEVGSEARGRRIEGGYLAGASSGLATQENEGRLD